MESDADIAASYIYNMMLEDEQDEQQKIDKKREDVKSDKKHRKDEKRKIHKRTNDIINSINLIFPNISKNRIGEILEKNNGDYQKTLIELNMNPPQKVSKRKNIK